MHVHVSPHNSSYGVDQLRRIIKGVIFYDNALTTIMPRTRKDNEWAQSNVRAIPAWLDAARNVPQKSWTPLFNHFDKQKMLAILLQGLCDNRYVGWNFNNVLGGCGTVEFRRPPGVSSAGEAKHWAALALGYVANAMALENWDVVKQSKSHPSTDRLRAAIRNGIGSLHSTSHGVLRSGLMADVNGSAIRPTPQELNRIKQKKALKSQKKLSLFAEKVRLSPFSSFRAYGIFG